jgi:hypothetical protein
MSTLTKLVALTTLAVAAVPAAGYAQPTPDEMARSLGEMQWHAAACHLPTAPLEAALERYIQRTEAGPIEAQHLRQEFLAGRTEYERSFGSHMRCDGAAAEIAAVIAKTDRERPR